MTILDGLKKLYVKLGGTIDSKHSYDDIGRLMEDVADVVNNSPGIPEVTSDDDGKVLGVVDGAWAKMDAPSGGSELVLKGTINENDITYEDEAIYQTLINAVTEGKRPILELTTENDGILFVNLARYQKGIDGEGTYNGDYTFWFTCTSVLGGGLKQYYTDISYESTPGHSVWDELS